MSFDDLDAAGSMAAAKAAGRVRIEGKDYVMQDGDVVEFRFRTCPALACSGSAPIRRPRWSAEALLDEAKSLLALCHNTASSASLRASVTGLSRRRTGVAMNGPISLDREMDVLRLLEKEPVPA